MAPCNLDDEIDSTALCKLEGTGFPVLTVLHEFYGRSASPPANQNVAMTHEEEERVVEMLKSKGQGTWRTLLALLKDLHQDELCHEIQQSLTGKLGEVAC